MSNPIQFETEQAFRYQSAIPLTNGKLAMLLFLSTEVMLFTALISSYIVLRFSGDGSWPDQSDVKVDMWLGLINTLVLLCSSFSMWKATASSASDNSGTAKFWLLVTAVLALSFLVIKGYEYKTKYDHGIYPSSSRGLIYERADDNYLSRAVREMRSQISQSEASESGDKDSERLEALYLIQAGVVDWTQLKSGSTGDKAVKAIAIESMAHLIYPTAEEPALEEYLRSETFDTRKVQEQLAKSLAEVEASLIGSQKALKQLLPDKENSKLQNRERFDSESRKVARLTDSITEIRKQLVPIENRLKVVDEISTVEGINQRFDLKLPMVIPGGNKWASVYYLLTGIHALHLLCGLMIMLGLLPFRLGVLQSGWLENLSLYWHFVDVVWLLIFAIVYLS